MADPLAATAAAPGGVAAMGYGAPGGFGVPPPQQALAPPPAEPWGTTATPPVVQVRCPACGMNTMATPGQPSFCFSCGQPIGSEVTKGGGGVNAPGFPVTGPMNAQPQSPAAPQGWLAATIRGTAGQFSVQAGSEVRVGRDPAQCPIFLSEPRVSGVHATLRLADGQLMVRDETSNNGTWVSGLRIAPGIWTAVPAGAPLRFGPVEFTVQVGA